MDATNDLCRSSASLKRISPTHSAVLSKKNTRNDRLRRGCSLMSNHAARLPFALCSDYLLFTVFISSLLRPHREKCCGYLSTGLQLG